MADPTDLLGFKNIFKPRKPHISTVIHSDELTGVSDLPIASRITKAGDTKPSNFQNLMAMEGKTITPLPFTFPHQGNVPARTQALAQRGFKKGQHGKIYPAEWMEYKNKKWNPKKEYDGVRFDLIMDDQNLPVSYKVNYKGNRDRFLRDLFLDPVERPKLQDMGTWELQDYLKNTHGIVADPGTISAIRVQTNMLTPIGNFQKSLKEINFTEFLKTHPGINKLTAEQIYALDHPTMKNYRELAESHGRSSDASIQHISQTRFDVGIKTDRTVTAKKMWEEGKMETVFGPLFHKENKAVADALTEFFNAKPERIHLSNKVVAEAINKEIPGSMDLMSRSDKWATGGVDYKRLKVWRESQGFYKGRKDIEKVKAADIAKQKIKYNPALTEKLNFQPTETLPNGEVVLGRKIKDIYTHKSGKDEMLADGTIVPKESTLIVQAHAYGSGKFVNPVNADQIKHKNIFFPDEKINGVIPREIIKTPQFFLTKALNGTHRGYENSLTGNLLQKYNLLGFDFKVTKRDTLGRGTEGKWTGSLNENLGNNATAELKRLEGLINDDIKRLENIDAYSLFYNPATKKVVTYGKPLHEIPNLSNLILAAKTKKQMPDITLSSGKMETGITKKDAGGLVRPHMSLGGDMAQFTEMESVVPDLNPAEAGMEDYTQLAMSIPKFKNPFKKVDPPPIMSDAASGLKITDKTKKGVKVEGTIKTEGQTPVFHLKSDLEIANSPLDQMSGQGWYEYLLKNGVTETEMHEFGLGNLLKNMGGWDEGAQSWKSTKDVTKAQEKLNAVRDQGKIFTKNFGEMMKKHKGNTSHPEVVAANKALQEHRLKIKVANDDLAKLKQGETALISKSELISQYKNNKPVISYKIQQMEPFEKGWKDFQSFLTGQRRGGGHYGDLPSSAREFEEMRQLRNKPQDIIGDRLRSNIIKFAQEISERTGRDVKTAWAELDPQITSNINKIIKEAYGIENVVENGFGNVKVPFYTQNLVNRFRRLKSGEGFYMGKTGVGHEGAQFLDGGTGYIEIPFTYNPNPKGMRANEPRFTFGEGHFTNPKGNNPVFWLRASERVDERGKRVFLIEEIQSDMHQKVKQKPDVFKYSQRHDTPEFINKTYSLSQVKKLKGDLVKVSDQIDKITGHTDPSAMTVMERLKVKREALRNQIREMEDLISEAAGKSDEVFPEGPWKKSENQAKIAIKTLINLATQEGFDSVAMISAKAKNHAVGASADIAKGNRGFYDNIAVSGMKNVAKNLNLEFSSTNIKDGKGNTWAKIPIINLKKEPVKASVDMYKAEGGYIHRPSFVDVVPVL